MYIRFSQKAYPVWHSMKNISHAFSAKINNFWNLGEKINSLRSNTPEIRSKRNVEIYFRFLRQLGSFVRGELLLRQYVSSQPRGHGHVCTEGISPTCLCPRDPLAHVQVFGLGRDPATNKKKLSHSYTYHICTLLNLGSKISTNWSQTVQENQCTSLDLSLSFYVERFKN